MEVIYLLIACSAAVALVFLAGFVWSVKRAQYDDTTGPAIRMLFDDEPASARSKKQNEPEH